MAIISIEEAQSRLSESIHSLILGDEVLITENDHTAARLIIMRPPGNTPRKLGALKGTVLSMAPDFDSPLEEFKDCTRMNLPIDNHALIGYVDEDH